jgi:hypothetical protein
MRNQATLFRRIAVAALLVPFLATTVVLPASAAMIGTELALAAEQRAANEAKVKETLSRDEVREQMIALGVDPGEAKARVSALSDTELAELATGMDTLPAGAGAGEVIIIIFLLLLVLELMGEINIFKSL